MMDDVITLRTENTMGTEPDIRFESGQKEKIEM